MADRVVRVEIRRQVQEPLEGAVYVAQRYDHPDQDLSFHRSVIIGVSYTSSQTT